MKSYNILLAMEHLRAMQGATGVERTQCALNAILAILSDKFEDDYGAYSILVALIAHITQHQPDRIETMKLLINGVIGCWVDNTKQEIEEALIKLDSGETLH